MGFLDKLKEGAGQAKDMAVAAAERAKDEAKELNLKRQIANEQEALGAKAFELAEQGAIAHAELEPHLGKLRELTAELEAHQSAEAAASTEEQAPSGEPAPKAPEKPAPSPPSASAQPPESSGPSSTPPSRNGPERPSSPSS